MVPVRLTRSFLYVLVVGALGAQVVRATGAWFLLPILGAFLVLVLSWGRRQPVPLHTGFGVSAGATLAGPFLWVAYVIGLFVFVYLYTFANAVITREWYTSPESREAMSSFLEFLRQDLRKAVDRHLLPQMSLRAFPYWVVNALLAGAGGLVGALLTQVLRGATRLEALDWIFLSRREREAETWVAQADPEMDERAAELMRAGFSQDEARSLVLKEWHDPALAKIRERERASKRP